MQTLNLKFAVFNSRKEDEQYQMLMSNQPQSTTSADSVSNAYDNPGCQADAITSC